MGWRNFSKTAEKKFIQPTRSGCYTLGTGRGFQENETSKYSILSIHLPDKEINLEEPNRLPSPHRIHPLHVGWRNFFPLSQKSFSSPSMLCRCVVHSARIWLVIHVNRIFLMNPNFLLVHRNRYSEGMDDRQKTPRGHPDFNSYVKIQHAFIDNGETNRQTVKQTNRQTNRQRD